MTEFKLEG